MRFTAQIALFVPLLLCPSLDGQVRTVTSPDGRITVNAGLARRLENPQEEQFYYSVSFAGKPVLLDSSFALQFKGAPPIAQNVEIVGEERDQRDETWTNALGKSRTVHDRYNELTLHLRERAAPGRRFDLLFRAYDDGIAFRYTLPETAGFSDFKLSAERTEFRFSGNPWVWAAEYGSFTTHQEAPFKRIRLDEIGVSDIVGCPLLVEVAEGCWAALTEADLDDWAGLYFRHSGTEPGMLLATLSPRLDEPDVAVISAAPRSSPWRTILIADRPTKLIESNLILNLNDPCQLEDTSWIKAGKSAWDRWWPGSYAPDYDGRLGVDNASMKYFIDFAAEMGWEYQLVDWYWYGLPFDPQKPFGSAGNLNVSILQSAPGIDIPQLVDYARSKGVRILIWLDWYNADRQMEEAFPLYERWGVAGVKVDFMARDDQEMVSFYHRLVKLAAQHHLTVDFHGAYKPTGLRRTWPNLLTREGVLGNEYNKWSSQVTPDHNVTLPFTRMLAGPMDYTPGGFRQKSAGDFRIVGSDVPGPFVMGTRAHQLAMMVVFESPLQVLCDSPYNYRASPAGLDLLRSVPTVWDETRVLDGYPGEYVVIARRSGDEWYIGAMTGSEKRALEIPLDFLGKGNWTATIWSDPDEAPDYPDRLAVTETTMGVFNRLQVEMAAGGGFVARLVR